jgi:subtilase family serine protease
MEQQSQQNSNDNKNNNNKDIIILRDNIEFKILAALAVNDAVSALKPIYNEEEYSVLPLYVDTALPKEYEYLMLLLF